MGAGFLRVLIALDRQCEPLDDVAGGGAPAVAEGCNRRAEDDRPGIVGGAAGVVFRHVDEKFQAAGERRRADAKYGLSAAIFVKGAHGDETLFTGVAEQGLGEDLDLIAVGFEQSALTGVTHGAKWKGRVGGPPLASSSSKRNLVVYHGAADSLLGLLCRDLSLGRRRCCGVGHFPAHDFE